MAMYEVRFKIDYEKCTDEKNEQFLQEYNGMNYHKSLQEYRYKASKMDMYPEDKLFFEMLCDIKKDLLELKNLKKEALLTLSNTTYSSSINYEEIAVVDELEIGSEYYMRLVLNDITMACFAKAIDTKLLKITKLKRHDEESLNHFVADVQRYLIYSKKENNGN